MRYLATCGVAVVAMIVILGTEYLPANSHTFSESSFPLAFNYPEGFELDTERSDAETLTLRSAGLLPTECRIQVAREDQISAATGFGYEIFNTLNHFRSQVIERLETEYQLLSVGGYWRGRMIGDDNAGHIFIEGWRRDDPEMTPLRIWKASTAAGDNRVIILCTQRIMGRVGEMVTTNEAGLHVDLEGKEAAAAFLMITQSLRLSD